MSFADLIAVADVAVQAALAGDEVITYAPTDGVAVPVEGIFEAQYVLAKGSALAGVEALAPAVFLRREVRSALLVDPEDDDNPTVTVNTVPYRVIERRPDGVGGIVLVLRKRS